jgi:hypothetical protein
MLILNKYFYKNKKLKLYFGDVQLFSKTSFTKGSILKGVY